MVDIRDLIRPELLNIAPYSSARHEFSGNAHVWLDANENPYPSALNRYPDPSQHDLKIMIADLKQVQTPNIFLGNGSDEAIDLLIRLFCRPYQDNILIMPPTYGMYKVSAAINAVDCRPVALTGEFQPNVDAVLSACQQHSIKIVFCCSPNNPTGNVISRQAIQTLLEQSGCLVVVDQAYIDFASSSGVLTELINRYSNLILLQTFSKAWGMAGARLGMALACSDVIEYLDKIKPPYNINSLTIQEASHRIRQVSTVEDHVRNIAAGRIWLDKLLNTLPVVTKVHPSETNFLLVEFRDAQGVLHNLRNAGIIVRDRSGQVPNCLRITVGTTKENEQLVEALKSHS